MELLYESSQKLLTYSNEEIKANEQYGVFLYQNNKMLKFINECLNKHYKNKIKQDIAGRKVYFNDKNSLIFQITSIIPWNKREYFDKTLKKYRKLKKEKDDDAYSIFKENLIEITEIENIEDFRIINKRIIIKNFNEIYYMVNKKIRRIKPKFFWFTKFMTYFIVDTLWHEKPFDEKNKKILSFFNNIFPNIKALVKLGLIEKTCDFKDFFNKLSDCNVSPKTDLEKNPITKAVLNQIKNKDSLNKYLFYRDNIGIKDINVLNKIATLSKMPTKLGKINFLKIYYNELKKYYKDKNENVDLIFYNRVKNSFDYNSSEAKDSLRMLSLIIHNRKKEQKVKLRTFDYKILKKDLIEMHDYLARLVRNDVALLNYKKYEFSFSKQIEKRYENYNFLIPKNNIELARIADLFDNCVAGYVNKINEYDFVLYATNSEDFINYVKNEKGNPDSIREKLDSEGETPACIEIIREVQKDENGKKFYQRKCVQARSFHNMALNSKTRKVIKSYFKDINCNFRSYY